jgi:hypothetical protein
MNLRQRLSLHILSVLCDERRESLDGSELPVTSNMSKH